MFIGHIALGFAAKRAAPETSLATLVAASTLVDLAWPVLLLCGVESVRIAPGKTAFTPLDFVYYPWTHSLAMVALWAMGFALLFRPRSHQTRGALVLAALVGSHWVLDWISHGPDLPLLPGVSTKVGLGLWNSRPATLLVEGALFIGGVALYLHSTRAARLRGHAALWTFFAFLILSYVANLSAPPPSAKLLALGALSAWIYLPWLAWVERNRWTLGDRGRTRPCSVFERAPDANGATNDHSND